jgi:hypothetical protein
LRALPVLLDQLDLSKYLFLTLMSAASGLPSVVLDVINPVMSVLAADYQLNGKLYSHSLSQTSKVCTHLMSFTSSLRKGLS